MSTRLTPEQRNAQDRAAAMFRRNLRVAGAQVTGDDDDTVLPDDDFAAPSPSVPVYDIDVADVEATLIFRIAGERVAVDIPPIRVAYLSKVVWYTNRYAQLTQKLMNTTQEREVETLLALINKNQRDLIHYVIPDFPDDLLARLDSTAYARLVGTIEAILQRHVAVRTGGRLDPKALPAPDSGPSG